MPQTLKIKLLLQKISPASRVILQRQILLLGGMVAQKATSAAIVILLCRYLLPEQFGAYVVAMSLIELAFLFIGFGTQTIMIRAIAQGRDVDAVCRAGLVTRLAAALPGIPALLVAAALIPAQGGIGALALLMLPGMLAYVFAEIPIALLLARNRMAWKACLDLAAGLLGFALMFAFLRCGWGLKGAAAAFSIRRVFQLLLAQWMCTRINAAELTHQKTLVPASFGSETRRLLREAAPLGIAGLAVAFHARWAPLLLAAWVSSEASGLFASAWQFFELITLVGTVMAGAAFPAMASAYAQSRAHGSSLALNTAMINLLAGILLAAVASLLAQWALPLVLGRAFSPSAPVLRVLLSATPLIFLYEMILHSLYANGRQRRVAAMRLLGLVSGLLLNCLLLPRHGIIGGAWATLANECIMTIGMLCMAADKRFIAPALIAGAGGACVFCVAFLF